jgi:hypothetical protein
MLTNVHKATLCVIGFTIDMGMVAMGPAAAAPCFMVGALGFGIAAVGFLLLDIVEARRAAKSNKTRLEEWKEKCKRE